MITYLYSVCVADCNTKDERRQKVTEEINFLKGQMTDKEFDDAIVIGIPVQADSSLGILYTEQK